MTLEEAKKILDACKRCELRDHAFGDREIYWFDSRGAEVAFGYFGGDSKPCVGITVEGDEADGEFYGHAARELAKCGQEGAIDRNDETGPDTYRDGACMPGLTMEGVKKEICGS